VLGTGDVVTIKKLVINALPSPLHTSQTPAKAKGLATGWK
jgi:hypothetical protein